MSSVRVQAHPLESGYPFPTTETGAAWDTASFAQVCEIVISPPGGPQTLQLSAAPIGAYGPGTLYPLGLTPDAAARIAYRIRQWDLHEDITVDGVPSTADSVIDAGFPGSAAQNEQDLLIDYGVPANGSYVSLAIFYNAIRNSAENKVWAWDGDSYPGAVNTDAISNRALMVRSSTLVYPMIYHAGFLLTAPIEARKFGDILKGGDTAAEQGGNTTSLTYDEATCVFTGSATTTFTTTDEFDVETDHEQSYTFTLTPKKYWPYQDADGNPLYDEDTGLPV